MDEARIDEEMLGAQSGSQEEPSVDENQAPDQEMGIPPTPISANDSNETDGDNSLDSVDREPSTPGSGGQRLPVTQCGAASPRRAPLKKHWETEIVPKLEQHLGGSIRPPGILDYLIDKYPEDFEGCERKSLLRWLERRIKRFYEENGIGLPKRWKPCPKTHDRQPRRRRKRLMFPQEHPPGREIQVDFTHCDRLEVTIQGEPFPHQLLDARLSHSGWTYAEVFLGENVPALKQGLRNAFNELGGVPEVLRKDRHVSAVHHGNPVQSLEDFLEHYGLELSLTNQRRPWENGGAEKNNDRIKTNIEQALLIRNNRDFDSRGDYEEFVRSAVNWINRIPQVRQKLEDERTVLRRLPADPAPVYDVTLRTVNAYGVIQFNDCDYSVPGRTVGERVIVKAYAEHLEVFRNNRQFLVRWERLHTENGNRISLAHLVPYLLRKPGALTGLKKEYKEALYPRKSFKRAHENLKEWHAEEEQVSDMKPDHEYLRILALAASGDDDDQQREDEVDQVLKQLLDSGRRFGHTDVLRAMGSRPGDAYRNSGQHLL